MAVTNPYQPPAIADEDEADGVSARCRRLAKAALELAIIAAIYSGPCVLSFVTICERWGIPKNLSDFETFALGGLIRLSLFLSFGIGACGVAVGLWYFHRKRKRKMLMVSVVGAVLYSGALFVLLAM